MSAGINPILANSILNSIFSAAAWTPPAACYIQLHTGDPGIAGTANISSYTTRTSIGGSFATAVGGSKSLSATVTITASWSGTNNETITHVSFWDALTSGTFIASDLLDNPVVMTTGAPLTLSTLTIPFAPLAA